MALVLKIKHNGTLRRWVVLHTLPQKTSDFTLTFNQLEGKICELFHFASNKVLLITYVDKEGDVITLADDQDLLDACVVQGLNPLRLDVRIVESKHNTIADSVANTNPCVRSPSTCPVDNSADPVSNTCPHMTPPLASSAKNGNVEHSRKPPFPQVTADAIKQFLTKYTQGIEPNLQPAVLLKNIQKALKDFMQTLVHEGQRLAPRVTQPARSPAYARCASDPPVRTPSMDGTRLIVHLGVKCDGCNVYPIQGLRYKSTKVFNYDLCSSCFDKMGNENDYQKMEKPASLACHGFHHPSRSKGWATPFASGADGWKSECPFLRIPSGPPADMSEKLDASFVKDVSVFDGSGLVPGMHFTKLLRLQNIGSMPWPQGTQFVQIGGDKLAVEPAVDLKLPEVAVGLEFDIFVSMRAPDTAGNYISHFCLTAPNGERFGQSVWVAIQVVHKENDSSQVQAAFEVDEKTDAIDEASNIQDKIEPATDSQIEGGSSVSQDKEQKGFSFGNHESAYKADQGISSVTLADKSPQSLKAAHMDQDNVDFASDEVDGFSMIQKPVDTGSFKMMHAPVVSSQTAFLDPISAIQAQYARVIGINQESNLHVLEGMGFTNRNLNAVLLEKNKQDLQLTLDDLLLGSGWDNLLKGLHDMGFNDTHTNLRLLIKNEGSIKHVVKELVELEKQKEE